MSDQDNVPTPQPGPAAGQPSGVHADTSRRHGRKRGRGLFILLAMLVVGLTGALATSALSDFRGGPRYFRHSFMSGPLDPARAGDFADRGARHLAVEVDATPEQTEKLREIVRGAVKDILPMRERLMATRQQGRDLLIQPAIGRDDIEKARVEHMALADVFTRRVAQVLGDASEVLTPAQRRTLAERLPPAGGYWHGWRRG